VAVILDTDHLTILLRESSKADRLLRRLDLLATGAPDRWVPDAARSAIHLGRYVEPRNPADAAALPALTIRQVLLY
jgi:hypothetical protein